MSPEQLEGKPLDGQSDIFSLGAVLYESLTGEKAFSGNTQLSVAAAIVEKEPAPILKSKPMTPPSLERAIRMCLAKDREERWQSARDLASELAWIAQTDTGTQAPVSTRIGLRERLAWGLAVALGLLALLLALGVGRHSARLPQMVRTTLLPPAGRSFLPFNFASSRPRRSRASASRAPGAVQTKTWSNSTVMPVL
jgi:serine/threonine protein kinase